MLNDIVNEILDTIFKKPTMKGGKTPHDPCRGEEKCLGFASKTSMLKCCP
jgi:hypothetical protein